MKITITLDAVGITIINNLVSIDTGENSHAKVTIEGEVDRVAVKPSEEIKLAPSPTIERAGPPRFD